MRDNAEPCAERPHIPLFLAEQANVTAFTVHRMKFTRQQFQQRRFARTIWPENSGVTAQRDFEREVGEDLGVAAIYGDMFDIDDVGRGFLHGYRSPSMMAA